MSPSLPPAAPSSPSSAHRMTAAAPDSERPGPERRPDEDRRHDRGPRLRAYTIATRMNPYLLYLQHSAEVAGLPVEARGMGDPNLQFWDARALQRKLWYHRDQAQRVFSDDVLLFADAYDSLLEAGAEVILKKFRGLKKCEIVFSGETDCRVACIPGMLGAQASRTAVLAGASAGGGDRSPLSQKPLNETVWPTRYLCSGGFLGKASALREVFKKYTPEAFVLENPSKSEQYYWALVWGKEFQQSSSGLTWFFCKNFGMGSDGLGDPSYTPLVCVDDESQIFQSNMGFLPTKTLNQRVLADSFVGTAAHSWQSHPGVLFDFSRNPGERFSTRVTGTNPVVLHWNGFFKTNLARTYMELVGRSEITLSSVGSSVGASRKSSAQKGESGEQVGVQKGEDGQAGGAFSKNTTRTATSFVKQTRNRRLEAYNTLADSPFGKRASRAEVDALMPLDDFIAPAVYLDFDPDVPSYFFLGGQFGHVLVTDGQVAYCSFLLLVVVRVWWWARSGCRCGRRSGRLGWSGGGGGAGEEERTHILTVGADEVGHGEDVGEELRSVDDPVLGLGKGSSAGRACYTKASEKSSLGGLRQGDGIAKIASGTAPARISTSNRAKTPHVAFRFFLCAVFVAFVVAQIRLLYACSWHMLGAMKMDTFDSFSRTVVQYVGEFWGGILTHAPVLFPVLMTAYFTVHFGLWIQDEIL